MRRKWLDGHERQRRRLEIDAANIGSTAILETFLPSLGSLVIDTTNAGTVEGFTPEDWRQHAAEEPTSARRSNAS
jgi:hypothetical protein